MIYKFSLRIHCFNNYKNQKCQDLEVSYLIECVIPPEQNMARRRNRQNNFSCAKVATSSGKMAIMKLLYLTSIFVGFKLWLNFSSLNSFSLNNSEINMQRLILVPKCSHFRIKKTWSVFLNWIQSMIYLFPASTRVKRAPIILVGWSGIESPTTLFYCCHQTTWFVCFVQFIFHQFLILIALESTRLTHLKFPTIGI